MRGRVAALALVARRLCGEAARATVVPMHGCSGVSPTHHASATTLRGWGYAARGEDAFAALRTLATPPGPTLRALIAFYPRCEARYPGTPLAAPLRIHIGVLDD